MDLRSLARWSSASPARFHWVFQALLQESAVQMGQRLRLEMAAQALRSTDEKIGEIAMDSGYGTQVAFVQSFREAFGYSPTEFWHNPSYDGLLPCPNLVHHNDAFPSNLRFYQGYPHMQVEVKQAPRARLYACPPRVPIK